jgi:hypothetical protein
MRLAFCFLSNNVSKFFKMDTTFHYSLQNILSTCVSSFTKNVLFNPPMQYCDHWYGWNVKYKIYHFRSVIDMFWMRQDSFDMAGHADLIYIGDDDMEFLTGSTAVINQCCAYMQDNPDCGAIYLGGNFGGEGYFHKDEIYVANRGALGTNRGILVRNRPELLNNKFHALGAMFDCAVGFSAMLDGYYIARRLHVPIEHHTKSILTEDHKDKFYNLDYIRTHGIRSKIIKEIGEWKERSEWPEEIFRMYRQASWRKGFSPKYHQDGSIINVSADL